MEVKRRRAVGRTEPVRPFSAKRSYIAVALIGGMVSSTVLTLVVIPAIYAVVKEASIRTPRLDRMTNMLGGWSIGDGDARYFSSR